MFTLFYGSNTEIINKIINTINVKNILSNMDYTPYDIERDNSIKEICIKNNINFISKEDYLLNKIGTYNKIKNNKPYSIFTPFKNYAITFDVENQNIYKLKI